MATQEALVLINELSTNKYDGRYYTLILYNLEQSVSNNTSTFSWQLSANGGNSSWYAERDLKVVINGMTVYSKTNRVERYEGVIKTGSLTLTHNTNGTKSITASIEAAVYVSNINVKVSKTFELDRIMRQATITYAPNFEDEANPTINYNNPIGNNAEALEACISLTGATDDIKYRAISKTGNTYTFNLTEAERDVLRNASPNSNTLTVRFYVRTVIDGVKYLNYSTGTMTIINSAPTYSIQILDTNSETIALTGSASKIVKYYSTLKYKITPIVKKGATFSSVSVMSNSNKKTTLEGIFESVESNKLSVLVMDSRGNSISHNILLNMVYYEKLTCSVETNNITTSGDMEFTLKGVYFDNTFGKTANTLSLYYRVYEAGTVNKPAYTLADYDITVENYYKSTINITGLDYRLNYVVEAYAEDLLTGAVYATPYTVASVPVFDWGKNNFNFNVPVKIKNVDLMDIFHPVGSVLILENGVNPNNISVLRGGWDEIIPDNSIGDNFTYWKRIL